MKREEFLLRIQRICFDIEALTKEYGSDRVISLVVLGCVEDNDEGELPRMSALYNYNIEDRDELNSVIDFIDLTWDDGFNEEQEGYKDIDDLLSGLNIDLED
jgi:hypothetical protein|tara:strand:- start:2523 stop:2828 length:306 start_codon:yes stop_codon:yes gene_type:complete